MSNEKLQEYFSAKVQEIAIVNEQEETQTTQDLSDNEHDHDIDQSCEEVDQLLMTKPIQNGRTEARETHWPQGRPKGR